MNGIKRHKTIALDSNIFIYHFEDNPEFISSTNKIFGAMSENKLRVVTSIISVIEALSYPLLKEVQKHIKESFQELPNLLIFELNHEIALHAAKIR